jgi:hypothetical protein
VALERNENQAWDFYRENQARKQLKVRRGEAWHRFLVAILPPGGESVSENDSNKEK